MNTKWYEFHQNNSGGSFQIDEDAGIGPLVCIEATSAEHANARAEEIGIYFDGCAKGIDCSCCGNRWYTAWGEGDADFPSEHGKRLVRAERQAPEGFTTRRFAHPIDGPFFIVAPEQAPALS